MGAIGLMWRPLWAIVERELKWTVRQRSRLLSAMVRPLLWLLTVGVGFEAMLRETGADNYRAFLVPGLLAMVLLFGAMLASLSMVYDRESGVLRMLIVAPFAHSWIVVARWVSATLVGLVQAAMLLAVLSAMGYLGAGVSLPLLAVGLIATSMACAAIGILIAVSTRALDNFAVVMNFVIFPVFFLSGALYPVRHLPGWLKFVASANPFSYGVDLLKHATIRASVPPFGADFAVSSDILVLIAFTAAAVGAAAIRFSQDSVAEALARWLSDGRWS
jgi:ABC-2 type transport system permease protein